MGAARYVNGSRQLNTRDLHTYMRRARAGESTTLQSETLPPEERARETMAIQLRRAEGIHRRDFLQQTGFDLDALAGPILQRQAALGLIIEDGMGVRLTRQGKYVADTLVAQLLADNNK